MHCLDSSKDGLLVLRHITSQKLKPTVELVCFFCRFPGEKLHCLDSSKDGLLVLRHITSQKLKPTVELIVSSPGFQERSCTVWTVVKMGCWCYGTSQKLKPTVELVCFFSRFPGEKLHCLNSSKDGLLVLRHITSQKLKPTVELVVSSPGFQERSCTVWTVVKTGCWCYDTSHHRS